MDRPLRYTHTDIIKKRLEFIKDNPQMTIAQMIHHLKASYSSIWNLCTRLNLPFVEKERRKRKAKIESAFFKVEKRGNWLV